MAAQSCAQPLPLPPPQYEILATLWQHRAALRDNTPELQYQILATRWQQRATQRLTPHLAVPNSDHMTAALILCGEEAAA